MKIRDRDDLVLRSRYVLDDLERERKAMRFYLLKGIQLNYRDNFITNEYVMKGERMKAWRVGDVELTDRQLFSFFRYFVEEKVGSMARVRYADIPVVAGSFCDWLVLRDARYARLVNEHGEFRRDVEAYVAAKVNESVFESLKSGRNREYLSLVAMSEDTFFPLLLWGLLRSLREFAHEAQGRADKYARLTETSERMMTAFIEDMRDRMREITESALGKLMRYRERMMLRGADEDKPDGTQL